MTILFWLAAGLFVLFGFVVFRNGAPYVPSRGRDLKVAFEQLYPLSPSEVLVDVGAGDGVVLRYAASYGTRAIGYELNPVLVVIGRFLNRRAKGTEMILADFYRIKLPPETTCVYIFGDGRDIKKIADKIQQETDRLGKPIHVISLAFRIPDREIKKHVEPYFLYQFEPLHATKP